MPAPPMSCSNFLRAELRWGGAHGQNRTKAAFEQCGEECCHPPPCQFGEDSGLCKSTCPTLLAHIAPTVLGGTARGDLRCRPFREMHICWTPWARTSSEQRWASGLWCSVWLSVCLCLSVSVLFRVCASSVSFFLLPFFIIPFTSPLIVSSSLHSLLVSSSLHLFLPPPP